MEKLFKNWSITMILVVVAALFGIMLAWSFPQYNPIDSGEELTQEEAMEEDMENMEGEFEGMDMEDMEGEFEGIDEELDALEEEL